MNRCMRHLQDPANLPVWTTSGKYLGFCEAFGFFREFSGWFGDARVAGVDFFLGHIANRCGPGDYSEKKT
jgi:hypothetical protein